MAQLAPQIAPARRRQAHPTEGRAPRPALTVVTKPDTPRSSVVFYATWTLLLLSSLIGTLMLSISMSNTSFEITRLTIQTRELDTRKQQLHERVEQLGTPQELERKARAMGMVPAGEIAYIDVATGEIKGNVGGPSTQPIAGFVPVDAGDPEPLPEYEYGMGNPR